MPSGERVRHAHCCGKAPRALLGPVTRRCGWRGFCRFLLLSRFPKRSDVKGSNGPAARLIDGAQLASRTPRLPGKGERLLDTPPAPEQYRACSAFSGNAQAPADHSLARGNRLRRGPCRLSSRQGGASGHRPGQPHPLLGNLRCGISTVHVTSAVSGQLVAMGQVTYRLLEPWPEG